MQDLISKKLIESSQVIEACQRPEYLSLIETVANLCITSLKKGGTIFFCGNGGSFADAQHLSAELTGRFYKNRRPFASIALGSNGPLLSAVANDYDYTTIFSRELEALGKEGDVLIAISTSGNSANVLKSMEVAADKRIDTVAITGLNESPISKASTHWINIPSTDTPRIQEAYKVIGHILCEIIEDTLCD